MGTVGIITITTMMDITIIINENDCVYSAPIRIARKNSDGILSRKAFQSYN